MQLEFRLEAAVIAFPLARRRKLVEQVARTIMRENDEDGLRYWKAMIRSLTDPLLASGIPLATVQAEAQRFHDAVQFALWRMEDQPVRPGGAG